MLSAILIKNLITNKTNVSIGILTLQDQRFENFWINLAGTDKDTIKTALLAVLATPFANVRRQVAVDIASIAAIEIPRKEFLDLIPNLNANSSSTQLDVKLASLETLSRVCEEVDPSDLTTELKNLVVTALVTNFKSEPELIKATQFALNGFLHGIAYASEALRVEANRNVIIGNLFQMLKA